MIEAKKSFLFDKIFAVYNRKLIGRRFHALRVSGIDEIRNRNEVILIGKCGDLLITAEDLARATDTISYEITCGINSLALIHILRCCLNLLSL